MPRLKEFLAAQVGRAHDRHRGRPRPGARGARAGRAVRGRPHAGDGAAPARPSEGAGATERRRSTSRLASAASACSRHSSFIPTEAEEKVRSRTEQPSGARSRVARLRSSSRGRRVRSSFFGAPLAGASSGADSESNPALTGRRRSLPDLQPLDDLVERRRLDLQELRRALLDAARAAQGRADEPPLVVLDELLVGRAVLRQADGQLAAVGLRARSRAAGRGRSGRPAGRARRRARGRSRARARCPASRGRAAPGIASGSMPDDRLGVLRRRRGA